MLVEETTRSCSRCNVEQNIELFIQQPHRNNQRVWECDKCRKARSRKNGNKRYHKTVKTSIHYRAVNLYYGALGRTKLKGLDNNLDVPWIEERIRNGFCEVTGIPFKLDYPTNPGGSKGHRAFSPSLDRQDNSKGYTKENTKVVVWIYNAAKGVNSHEDVVTLSEALCLQS